MFADANDGADDHVGKFWILLNQLDSHNVCKIVGQSFRGKALIHCYV